MVSRVVEEIIKKVAQMSNETTSGLIFYEPIVPEKLKKKEHNSKQTKDV